MCNLTENFKPASEKEQIEMYYEELYNDPDFIRYLELKHEEWMEGMSKHYETLQNEKSLASELGKVIPEDTSYSDFAKAVAKILREDYGTHNYNNFMGVLHAELGMEESLNEKNPSITEGSI